MSVFRVLGMHNFGQASRFLPTADWHTGALDEQIASKTDVRDRHRKINWSQCQSRSSAVGILHPLSGVFVPGGARGAMAPPYFGRSVNPISTAWDRLCPPNYYWNHGIFRPSDGTALWCITTILAWQSLMGKEFKNTTQPRSIQKVQSNVKVPLWFWKKKNHEVYLFNKELYRNVY